MPAISASRSLVTRGYPASTTITFFILFVGVLYMIPLAAEFKIFDNLGTANSKTNTSRTAQTTDNEIPVDFMLHSSCIDKDIVKSNKYNRTVSEMAKNFHVDENSYGVTKSNDIDSGAMTLHFQIKECPFRHEASTFHVQTRTGDSIFAGSVGYRYKVEEDCGYYNATVPIPSFAPDNTVQERKCGDATVTSTFLATVEAFWTSEYRNYGHRMDDRKIFQQLYDHQNTLTPENMTNMLGEDRLRYLTRNLDILPSFPVVIEFSKDVIDTFQPQFAMANCTDVPLKDWLPVGTHQSTDDPKNWYFQSHKCNYRTFDRKDLQYLFAGMRVKYLADSHGNLESWYVQSLTCPEAKNSDIFYGDKYVCSMKSADVSQPLNTFSFAFRFYRGIEWYQGDGKQEVDMDGLTTGMRHVKKSTCLKFLGIGAYNVTIITTPSWVSIYETSEGLLDYVHSLRSFIEYCRKIYPEEIDNLIILVQTPIAGDVIDKIKDSTKAWKHSHNFLMESFSRAIRSGLDGVVDGVLPIFEFTLARNWIRGTIDGVHLETSYYNEIFHIQAMAVLSSMRSRGWHIPLIRENDEGARWFENVPLE